MGMPIGKKKGMAAHPLFYYRLCGSLIAGRLPSGSACFPFGLAVKVKKVLLK